MFHKTAKKTETKDQNKWFPLCLEVVAFWLKSNLFFEQNKTESKPFHVKTTLSNSIAVHIFNRTIVVFPKNDFHGTPHAHTRPVWHFQRAPHEMTPGAFSCAHWGMAPDYSSAPVRVVHTLLEPEEWAAYPQIHCVLQDQKWPQIIKV